MALDRIHRTVGMNETLVMSLERMWTFSLELRGHSLITFLIEKEKNFWVIRPIIIGCKRMQSEMGEEGGGQERRKWFASSSN